jgi:hypothetical protein
VKQISLNDDNFVNRKSLIDIRKSKYNNSTILIGQTFEYMNIEQGLTNNEFRSEKMRKHDLEDRLINFAVLIIKITEEMSENKAANHLQNKKDF